MMTSKEYDDAKRLLAGVKKTMTPEEYETARDSWVAAVTAYLHAAEEWQLAKTTYAVAFVEWQRVLEVVRDER